jgi:hypothetical protein
MIVPSNRVRIMVATVPIGLRKGHDSQPATERNALRMGPFNGAARVIRAGIADRLKLLDWDGTGQVSACTWLEEHPLERLEKLVAAWKQAAFRRRSEKRDPDRFEPAPDDLETVMAVIHAEEFAEDRVARCPARPRPPIARRCRNSCRASNR